MIELKEIELIAEAIRIDNNIGNVNEQIAKKCNRIKELVDIVLEKSNGKGIKIMITKISDKNEKAIKLFDDLETASVFYRNALTEIKTNRENYNLMIEIVSME